METKREEEKEQQTTEQDKKETDKKAAINGQHAKVEEERGEEEEEEDKLAEEGDEEGDELTEEEVGKMTVAQLNTELKKRKIEAPPKALKKVLQKLLLTSLPSPSKHQKYLEAQVLKYLVEQYGTKLANLIHYLRKLWADDPNARVIMFSQFTNFLNNIVRILPIESAYVEGNVMRRGKALQSFKKADSDIRVILMSLESSASGSNLIAATDIISMERLP